MCPGHVNNTWLLSIRSDYWDCQPDGRLRTEFRDLEEGARVMNLFAPKFEKSIQAAMINCDIYTTDKIPYARKCVSMQDVVYVTGSSGAGYKLGPGIAKMGLLIGIRL